MLIGAWILSIANLSAQLCPENIDFENGSFRNWMINGGFISETSIDIDILPEPAIGRHTIISDKNAVDEYGQFPLIPKNGGNYIVKLGNNGTGAQVDGLSYLITVPQNRPEFTITYQYAVVLEDPTHLQVEQPRFITRVKDVKTNQYIECATYQYIATSNLPGFKKSTASPIVIYKEWTPVTINLSGYQGRDLVLEFISTDCTLGGHFGYAYIDVNSLCGDLITGNTYCKSSNQITLSGPSGFQNYTWYNENRTINYGSTQNIVIKPTPADGTKFILDVAPFDGFGCPSTIITTVTSVDYNLQLTPKVTVCQGSTIDLISGDYILNRHPDFSYFVYEDKDLTIPVNAPITVTQNKTYYIMATNYKGCTSIASIDIIVFDLALMKIKNPPNVCYNETVDITNADIYIGDLTNCTRSYYTNIEATNVLQNPTKVGLSGKYYVKITSSLGCVKILPIDVVHNPKPMLKVTNPIAVCFPSTIDITEKSLFAGSDSDFSFSFFYDELATKEIANPKIIAATGTYFVKAINAQGCAVVAPIRVEVHEPPTLIVKNPEPVCYPWTVDITSADLYIETTHGVKFEFFKDSSLSIKLSQPSQVSESGTYYVRVTNQHGCTATEKINVTINKLPVIVLTKLKPIFDDEFIDLTAPEIVNGSKSYYKIKYYSDALLSNPVVQPSKVNKAGIYYLSLENESGCNTVASVTVDVLPAPKVFVPTAFTPQKATNNRLYPFFTSIQKLSSFKVYNKWGLLVYETNSMQTDGWDGQVKSRMQPLETYSWFADGIDILGRKFQSKGKTILIL
ncbi:gliding motility-associated C-terminal domain-containing protein [Pedobacter aquatilis]|uniref:gliding motility-associated C-terminal domain-containing protein n=1 Tax=Pedobacter aquatilis TaxID=351343 RepID=UPI00292D6259|nr:gliding motility-associated C-terminal domain-containing protein [Pedobacter aquatilis]